MANIKVIVYCPDCQKEVTISVNEYDFDFYKDYDTNYLDLGVSCPVCGNFIEQSLEAE